MQQFADASSDSRADNVSSAAANHAANNAPDHAAHHAANHASNNAPNHASNNAADGCPASADPPRSKLVANSKRQLHSEWELPPESKLSFELWQQGVMQYPGHWGDYHKCRSIQD
jgi:hypothetical protein